jgi:hypothetical protein
MFLPAVRPCFTVIQDHRQNYAFLYIIIFTFLDSRWEEDMFFHPSIHRSRTGENCLVVKHDWERINIGIQPSPFHHAITLMHI